MTSEGPSNAEKIFAVRCVNAHPDDEQGVSGLMRKYAQLGAGVTLVCGTRGEAGEIAPGVNATPATLGQVREEELRCAAEKIGVENLELSRLRRFGNDGHQGKCRPPQFVERGSL